MVQYEELSENAKKAVEQFRNCRKIGLDFRHKKFEYQVLFLCACTLNDVKDFDLTLEFAKSKNYWLTDKIKKEENKK